MLQKNFIGQKYQSNAVIPSGPVAFPGASQGWRWFSSSGFTLFWELGALSRFSQHVATYAQKLKIIKSLVFPWLSHRADAGKWQAEEWSLGSAQDEEASLVRVPIVLKIIMHITSDIFPENIKSHFIIRNNGLQIFVAL